MRRYAGILIDLSFDHYLSVHWSRFSEALLTDFNRQIYSTLKTHEDALSDGARRMADRLIEYDVLNLYLEWETVPATAARIGQRFKRHNPFLGIDDELSPAKYALEQAFLSFYPQLQSFSKAQAHAL